MNCDKGEGKGNGGQGEAKAHPSADPLSQMAKFSDVQATGQGFHTFSHR